MADSEKQREKALDQRDKDLRRFIERTKKRQTVFRGDGFDRALFGYLNSEHAERTHQTLNEKRFTLKRSEVGTRVINHWESEGVTEDPRKGGTGWRRFSVLDLMWLHAVARLRSFGMPMEKLKRARQSLEGLPSFSLEDGPEITLYEFYVTQALLRQPVSLIVFEDGEVELLAEGHSSERITRVIGGLADHVRISLNGILRKLFPKIDLAPEVDMPLNVSDEEVHVLLTLRTGNYQSVTIKYHDGEIERIEAEEEVPERRIIDILKEADFQDVTIKRRDGKEVHVSRTVLKKL
jgi:DNA-binding transcriptional MerR regulator